VGCSHGSGRDGKLDGDGYLGRLVKMGNRRKTREMAMQALFFMDISKDVSASQLDLFCRCYKPSKNIEVFFQKLTRGILKHWLYINDVIEKYSSNWKLNRMACVDRNIIRIAVYEILFCEEIPPRVAINEAIDIGKKYGTDGSGAFINGILDSIHTAMTKGEISIEQS
jgi:transcription antitermination protein NusB